MLGRLIRIFLASLLALAILLVGGAGLVLLAFNPDAFKSALIGSVQQRYHRRLELPGSLQLHLFPPFTLQTGPMRLSETDGHTPFAQAADMRLHLDPLALLRRHIVIDAIELDAPRVHLRRGADGRWNFSDLLGAPSAKVPALDIHSLRVRDGDIVLSDASRGLEGQLSQVSANATGIGLAGWHPLSLRGHAVLAAPSADTRFDLRGRLHASADGSISLRDLVLRSDGRLFGSSRMLSNLHAAVHWTAAPSRGLQVRDLHLRAQGRMGDGQPLQLELDDPLLQWSDTWTRVGPLHGDALIGAAPSTLHASLRSNPIDGPAADLVLPSLELRLERAAPSPLRVSLQFGAHLDLPARSAVIDTLRTRATWGKAPRSGSWNAQGLGSYSPAQGLQLNLHGDDPGLPLRLQASAGSAGLQLQAQAHALELPALPDLQTWQRVGAVLAALPAGRLQLQADSLRVGRLQLAQLDAQAHDDASRLTLDSLRGRAWGGRLQASGSVALGSAAAGRTPGAQGPAAALHASLRAASATELLDALYGAAVLDGRAELHADLQWLPRGAGASGTASLTVRDGRLHGIDLGHASMAAANASSAFALLDAQALLTNGVATLQSLRLRTAAGAWQGQGSFAPATAALRVLLSPTNAPRAPAMRHARALRIDGTAASPRFAWQAASAPADATAAGPASAQRAATYRPK